MIKRDVVYTALGLASSLQGQVVTPIAVEASQEDVQAYWGERVS